MAKKEQNKEIGTEEPTNALFAAIVKVDKEEKQKATNQIAEILRTLKEMKTARAKAKNRIKELCVEFEIDFEGDLEKLLADF